MKSITTGVLVAATLWGVPDFALAQATTQATPPSGTMVTLQQADAIIMQMGFTPVGQPLLKGTTIGSLARLGNNPFIVTVDATTGKFLDAKPTDMPLPPSIVSAPAPVPTTTPPAATPPPATGIPSPVMTAANLARSKGFRVLSFKHQGDDTFLVGQKADALYQLKVSDKGVLLAVTPIEKQDDN